MRLKVLALLLMSVLPGIGVVGISSYFLLSDWEALNQAHRSYEELTSEGAGQRELSIAQAAEMRHRMNCFAEGGGALLGGIIVSIGVHGLCTLSKNHE